MFDTNTFLAGASGGCYALIGAHFAIVVMVTRALRNYRFAECLQFVAGFVMLRAVICFGYEIALLPLCAVCSVQCFSCCKVNDNVCNLSCFVCWSSIRPDSV